MGFTDVWAYFNRLLVSPNGLPEIAPLGIQNPELQVSFTKLGIDCHSFFEQRLGLVQALRIPGSSRSFPKDQRVIIIGERIPGLLPHKPRQPLLAARQRHRRCLFHFAKEEIGSQVSRPQVGGIAESACRLVVGAAGVKSRPESGQHPR